MGAFCYTDAMKEMQLRTNPVALNVGIAKAGLWVLVTCALITVLFRTVIGIGSNVESYLLWALWVLLPGMWVIGSMIARDKWRKSSYSLTKDAVVVTKGNMVGGKSRQMYRYDAIIAVDVEQDLWGSRFGFGDVHLEIPRLGRRVILRAVNNPHEQTKQLKARVTQQSATQPLSGI
jgi:uncharacterized membrane protein YdbT with pleckstrin-like domain